jgi:hypothetical protein
MSTEPLALELQTAPRVLIGSGALLGSVSPRWFTNMWASCGHRLTVRDGPNKDGDSWSVRYADYDREGGRSVVYASVCNKCYGWWRARGALLTHEQAGAWMRDGVLPALPNAPGEPRDL